MILQVCGMKLFVLSLPTMIVWTGSLCIDNVLRSLKMECGSAVSSRGPTTAASGGLFSLPTRGKL